MPYYENLARLLGGQGQGLGGHRSLLGGAQPLGLERIEGVSPMTSPTPAPAPTQVAPSPATAIGASGTQQLTPAQEAWEATAKGYKWLAGAGKSLGAALDRPETQMALSQLGMAMSKPGEFGHELGKSNIEMLQGQAYEQYVEDVGAGREPTTGRMLPASMIAQAQQQVSAERAAEQLGRQRELDIKREETRPDWDIEFERRKILAGEPSRVAGGLAAGRATEAAEVAGQKAEVDRSYDIIKSIVSTIDPTLKDATSETIMDALRDMMSSPQKLRTLEQSAMLPEAIRTLQAMGQNVYGLEAFLEPKEFFTEPEVEALKRR